MTRLAINGFGRIGRLAFRAAVLLHPEELKIVAINTSGSMPAAGWAHLVKYDTTYRRFPKQIEVEEVKSPKEATDDDPLIGYLIVEGKKYPLLAQRDPAKLPWADYDVDVVIESTGVFRDRAGASKHLQAGAKSVVISAPAKGGDVPTAVIGVNQVQGEQVVSNASCTTNCISPVAKIIFRKFGIDKAMMTTIHGYTDDQRLQDNSHRDLHRARAAAQNIIPTTTGAAVATTQVIPELQGLFDGIAVRVPVPTGSLADFVFVVKTPTSVEEVNQAFIEAAASDEFRGVLTTVTDPIVSSDIIGQTYSSIVDLNFTKVIGGTLVKVLAWYDNEWGYTNRLVEQAIQVGQSI